jgi:CyaY protein
MDEQRYLELAKKTFDSILDAFDDVDSEDADIETAGDVIKIAFSDGVVCVLNTQRPVRQIWLAARDRAWHFDWDGTKWVDDRGSGDELVATIRRICTEHGVEMG